MKGLGLKGLGTRRALNLGVIFRVWGLRAWGDYKSPNIGVILRVWG